MKRITIIKYKCEYCDRVFDNEYLCQLHEKDEHKCPNCKHYHHLTTCVNGETNCGLKVCHFER